MSTIEKYNCVFCNKEMAGRKSVVKKHIENPNNDCHYIVCELGNKCYRSRFKKWTCDPEKPIYTIQEQSKHFELKHYQCNISRCERSHWTQSSAKKCYNSKKNRKLEEKKTKDVECTKCFKRLGCRIALINHQKSNACNNELEKRKRKFKNHFLNQHESINKRIKLTDSDTDDDEMKNSDGNTVPYDTENDQDEVIENSESGDDNGKTKNSNGKTAASETDQDELFENSQPVDDKNETKNTTPSENNQDEVIENSESGDDNDKTKNSNGNTETDQDELLENFQPADDKNETKNTTPSENDQDESAHKHNLCDLCGKKFQFKKTLMKHLKRIHQNVPMESENDEFIEEKVNDQMNHDVQTAPSDKDKENYQDESSVHLENDVNLWDIFTAIDNMSDFKAKLSNILLTKVS